MGSQSHKVAEKSSQLMVDDIKLRLDDFLWIPGTVLFVSAAHPINFIHYALQLFLQPESWLVSMQG